MDQFEASTPPALLGEYWLINGRLLPRVRGSESVGDAGAGVADAGDAGDQGGSTEIQGGSDQSGAGDDTGFEAPFSLNDVPEEFRGDVERYVKQTQGAFTRKTMELAEQRRQAEAMLDLDSRLADEGTRNEALKELLGRYDLELELDGGEDEDYERPDELKGLEDVDDEDLPQWAKDLIARDQKRQADDQAKAQAETETQLRTHVNGELDAYKARAFPDAEKIPDDSRDAILGLGMMLPAQEDGLPNMKAAVERLEAIEAAAVQRFIDGKRNTPPPPATRRGTSGTDKPDLSNQAQRLQQANVVAARHLDQ